MRSALWVCRTLYCSRQSVRCFSRMNGSDHHSPAFRFTARSWSIANSLQLATLFRYIVALVASHPLQAVPSNRFFSCSSFLNSLTPDTKHFCQLIQVTRGPSFWPTGQRQTFSFPRFLGNPTVMEGPRQLIALISERTKGADFIRVRERRGITLISPRLKRSPACEFCLLG